MRTTKNTSRTLKKLFGVVVAGAFAVVPFAGGVLPAQAAPPVWAKDDKNKDKGKDKREYQTLEGIVAIDRQGHRQFTLRLNNGQRIQVRSDEREPRRLSTGDRVRVVGFYRRHQPNLFHALSAQIIDNQNNARSYTGRVSKVDSAQRFDLVIGHTTYNVITSRRLPRRLNVSDRVRVYGRRTGNNDITNATVVVINNNGNNGNNNGYNTFTGRVSDVKSAKRFDLVVNGTTYNVMTSSRLPRRLDEDDQVRVYGRRTGNNDITNATVSILNNR